MTTTKRPPVYFIGADYWRYAKLSKADWADAFCDLYQQCMGEQSTPEQMISDAEHRVENLKVQGVR